MARSVKKVLQEQYDRLKKVMEKIIMARSVKKVLQEQYDRIKKVMEKIIKPKKEEPVPQLVLQPVRNKNI